MIHKRQYEYAAAENLFTEALRRFDAGQLFITDRTRNDIVYEIGMMLDGEGALRDALNKFQDVTQTAPKDSYFEMDASYEVARLSLAIWLERPSADRLQFLEDSIRRYSVWISREWPQFPSKIWAYYGEACARNEYTKFITKTGREHSGADIAKAKQAKERFLAEARGQTGVKKYQLRLTSFILTSREVEHFPGEPLFCGLDDILTEFAVH